MAADVLAGNDQDCCAWIRANRDPDAAGGAREGRAGGGRRRRPSESGASTMPRVVFTPSGLDGEVARRHHGAAGCA